MGLKGNLATVSLADVFQVLSRGNSSGLLRIVAPDGQRFVEFQNGLISTAGRSSTQMQLGDLLVARGFLDQNKLHQARKTQEESGLHLAQVLLEIGFVSASDLESAIQFHIEEEVCELFTLTSGDFDFLANAALDARMAPAGGLVRLKLDPDSVLLEAARRSDEWKDIQQRIPDQAVVFHPTVQGLKLCEAGNGVSPEGMAILKLVLDQRSVEAIVQTACLGRLNINRMLIELWDAHLIHPLAFADYPRVVDDAIKTNRLDEAELLARYAAKLGEADVRAKIAPLLSQIEQKRKKAAEPAAPEKTKQDTLRKIPQSLIIKRERPVWPFVAAAIVLIGVGVVLYQMFSATEVGGNEHRRLLDEAVFGARELLAQEKYAEALKKLQEFKTQDAEVKEVHKEQSAKLQQEVERMLLDGINQFIRAETSSNAEELKSAVDKLEAFEGVGGISDKTRGKFTEIRSKVAGFRARQTLEKYRSRFAELQNESKAKGNDFLYDGCLALLKENPPEEAAAPIRDELSRLYRLRNEAGRKLERGNTMAKLGDFESARAAYETVRRTYPNSKLAADAVQQIAELDKKLSEAQGRFGKIEILSTQKRVDEARTAAIEFLNTNPPRELVSRAFDTLRSLVSDPENEASALLRESQAMTGARARAKVLELIQKFPYSRSAGKATLRVEVTSIPEGAEASLDGTVLGKTPLFVDAPALGLTRLAFRLEGYQPQEIIESDFRGEKLAASLERIPSASRRLPFPARAGLTVLNDEFIAAGDAEIVGYLRNDLKFSRRMRIFENKPADGADAKPLVLTSITGFGRDCALTTSDKFAIVAQVQSLTAAQNSPETYRVNFEELAMGPAVLFAPQHLVGKVFVGAATKLGYELFERDGKLVKRSALHPGKNPPEGVAFDGDTFFIPGSDNTLHAIVAFTGEEQWGAQCGDRIISVPVFNRAQSAVSVQIARKLLIFDSETGRERARKDLAATARPEGAAVGDSFVVPHSDGKLEAFSASSGAALWTTQLNGPPELAPITSRFLEKEAKEPSTGFAICTVENGSHFLNCVSSTTGKLLWRARLSAAPVSGIVYGNSVLVATDDAELSLYLVK